MIPLRLIALLVPIATFGCHRREATYEIGAARTVRPLHRRVLRAVDSATRFGFAEAHAAAATGLGGMAFDFELPKGWRKLAPRPMRQLNFAIPGSATPGGATAECYVTVAGGSVAANLDRWRRQMGLSPVGEGAVSSLPRVRLFGRDAPLVELLGRFKGRAHSKLLGVIATLPATTVTVKMTGPAEVVDRERARFLSLCRSLHLGSPARQAAQQAAPQTGGQEQGSGQMGRGGFSRARLRWKVPDGWEDRHVVSSMRLVTLAAGAEKAAECAVLVLPGEAGGVSSNINRWRRQMARPPLDEAQIAALSRVMILGVRSAFLHVTGDYSGMGGASQKGWAMLAAVCPLEGNTLFVKMTGPAKDIAAEKGRFLSFCRSLEFRDG